ncbi:MAG: PAS domain-containing protein [Rhizomicrobium sp.]
MNFETLLRHSPHADLIRLAEHCQSLAGDRAMPHREDFRPGDVRWMLGYIYLVDVLDDGADYRIRLFGTFWQTIFGADIAGQRLSELEAVGVLTDLRRDYDVVAETGEPLFHPGKLVWPGKESIHYERLLIPFSREDGRISLILGAAHCDKAVEDLILYQGLGLPRLVLDEQIERT